jgi:hypothetical protein
VGRGNLSVRQQHPKAKEHHRFCTTLGRSNAMPSSFEHCRITTQNQSEYFIKNQMNLKNKVLSLSLFREH